MAKANMWDDMVRRAVEAHLHKQLGVQGFVHGGTIPGKVNPNIGDDTTIKAKKGEYVLPVEVVQALGKDNLDQLVYKIKLSLGMPDMPNGMDGKMMPGYVDGGQIDDLRKNPFQTVDPADKTGTFGLPGAMPNFVPQTNITPSTTIQPPPNIKGDLTEASLGNELTAPAYQSPQDKAYAAVSPDAQNITATINNGNAVVPVMNNQNLATPLTPEQAQALQQSWGQDAMGRVAGQTPYAAVNYTAPGVAGSGRKTGAQTIGINYQNPDGTMPAFMHPAGQPMAAGMSPADFQKQADMISFANNPAMATSFDVDKALIGPDGTMMTNPASKMDLLSNKMDQMEEMNKERLANAMAIARMNNGTKVQISLNKNGDINGGNIPGVNPNSPASADGTHPEVLGSLNPGMQQIVKNITQYKIPLPSGFALKTPYWQKIMEAASVYDPSFDASQYNVRMKLKNDFVSGKAAGNIRSLNTAVGHLDSLSTKADALGNAPIQLWNKIANAGLTATGDKRVTEFNAAATAVESELAAVFKGMGATDQEIHQWRQNLSSAQSPEQLKGAIHTAVELMGSRLGALQSQYETGLGKPKNFRFLNDKSRGILQKLGADVNSLDPVAQSQQSQPPQAATTGLTPAQLLKKHGIPTTQ